MADIVDVAKHILERCGRETTMKLQKLAFYSQAYSLASSGKPLFESDFEAWANGPAAPDLFRQHRGYFSITAKDFPGNSGNLTATERRQTGFIIAQFDRMSGNELSRKTHSEAPWKTARGGLPPTARSKTIISKDSIRTFYSQNPSALNMQPA
ncbi:DUF4065 domain-containing protein [Bifidobacterium sp. ESL0769]|uniref:Panacea domain-containing protein n=1 Tax=Bifidobacterium sp. ESL0769 TaxID=2983229 RepID=UPI0023F9EECF|nr:type II toxin-antitoxin system antitoxin SocA domain-containing protein [Bifidobacterium sp. ESL0769]WEV67364.1 DUF4065 domain-containing protein [Bifidobacterium sp. ESL0769]